MTYFYCFFRKIHISQGAVRTSFKKQLDPRGPIASQRGAVPEFLRELLIFKRMGSGPFFLFDKK